MGERETTGSELTRRAECPSDTKGGSSVLQKCKINRYFCIFANTVLKNLDTPERSTVANMDLILYCCTSQVVQIA